MPYQGQMQELTYGEQLLRERVRVCVRYRGAGD